MDKILLPLQDMLQIKNVLESNIDVLRDKSVLVKRLAFSEKNIPGYDSETEYIVNMCENYISTLKDRFSLVAECVVNIKNNKVSLDNLNKIKDTLPNSYKRLVIGSESYFTYDLVKEELNKSDRERFSIVMEGFNTIFKNEKIYDEALSILSENNFDKLNLQKDEENSIVLAAENYYGDLVLNDRYDKLRYTGTQWIEEKLNSFSENVLPEFKDKYNKDNEKLEKLGEQFHIILQNYINRIDKWVE